MIYEEGAKLKEGDFVYTCEASDKEKHIYGCDGPVKPYKAIIIRTDKTQLQYRRYNDVFGVDWSEEGLSSSQWFHVHKDGKTASIEYEKLKKCHGIDLLTEATYEFETDSPIYNQIRKVIDNIYEEISLKPNS